MSLSLSLPHPLALTSKHHLSAGVDLGVVHPSHDAGARLGARIAACNLAAERRGMAALSGVWRGQVTGCNRSGSLLASTTGEEGAVVTFAQSAGPILFTVDGKLEGNAFSFEVFGRIIENDVALTDPGNSDYHLIGNVAGMRITIRPDTDRVLAAWPDWAGPPERTDLESCLITLEPLVTTEDRTTR